MLIWNNKQLASFIGNTRASYAWLDNSLDFLVRKHQIPSIRSLTKAKPKKQVWKEVKEYLKQLRQETIREDLELSSHNMKIFISVPVKVKTLLVMCQNELDTGSKIVYLDAMEARVHFQQDIIKKFGDSITQYKAWNQYVIEKKQVEVVELDFPQTPESQRCVLLGCPYPILSYMGTSGKCNIICNYVIIRIPSVNIRI